MTEFSLRYAKLSREQRLKVREDLMAAVMFNMSMAFKGNATAKQVKAAARKKVDQAISLARKAA